MVIVRDFRDGDAPILADLFAQTVRTSNAGDYGPEQIETWVAIAADPEAWQQRLSEQHTVVCEAHGTIAGFASLDHDAYLDLLYTAREFQRRGVATRLLDELERWLRAQGVAALATDASITARPFFERRGYSMVAQRTVHLRGVEFVNFRMVRIL